MPSLEISPSVSSFENTGGLCGLWDNYKGNDLYILNKDGVDEVTTSLSAVEEYWK